MIMSTIFVNKDLMSGLELICFPSYFSPKHRNNSMFWRSIPQELATILMTAIRNPIYLEVRLYRVKDYPPLIIAWSISQGWCFVHGVISERLCKKIGVAVNNEVSRGESNIRVLYHDRRKWVYRVLVVVGAMAPIGAIPILDSPLWLLLLWVVMALFSSLLIFCIYFVWGEKILNARVSLRKWEMTQQGLHEAGFFPPTS